ncbi:hypothetical protein [Streptomyces sp. NPDC058612]|uniref:hypothetical protein n=1 Tax=Streptomyces sp. NPDC058612 TaxID=3346555 RepID=UPI00365F5E71
MPESSRLEDAMDKQRGVIGLTWRQVAERAGISYETLRAIRKGEQAGGDVTRRKIERAIGWGPESFESIEAGNEPFPAATDSAAPLQDAEDLADPQVEAILTILDGLPERVQAEVLRRLGDRLPAAADPRRKAS